MIKKIGLLILILILSIILASVYGIIHNQISYSISEEYFTKFKLEQFGLEAYPDTVRLTIGMVGIWSTWWFGLLIGLISGIVAMFQSNTKAMWKSAIGSISRTLLVAVGFGILGILVGKFVITSLNIDWGIPTDLTDTDKFLTAGTMHNFSYVGGIVGLIYGVFYQMKIKKASAQQHL